MGFWAGLVLGTGLGALSTTPLAAVIVAVISGKDWREALHNHLT